ncbi:MAG TPA: molybdopterin-dependent oxidoreductase [Thermoanaerobaculia bacterium]|jgi:DMSO/TMAO reductase YedYZ molybdopterin-dependent catalytic subunit|nr:molybdopterin-dependent oxidoreductase [Thermoanaerobaculia bacterium]
MTDDRSLSRRHLLRLGLTAGAASLAGACGWQGGPLLPLLRGASRVNDWVGEKVLLSSDRLAPQYPISGRTPERYFPAYSITRPVPQLSDPGTWALEVGGLVRKPMRLTLEMLQALPRVTYTVKHHCVEGWSAIATWTGAPVSSVVALVEPTAEARYLRFDTFDRNYYNGWDMKSALHPQTILAYAFNDRPLTPAHGAPLRLYSPIKLGYKLTKYLTSMTFTAERPGGYWEDRGYPWHAGV